MQRNQVERKYVDMNEFCLRLAEAWGNIKQNSKYRCFYQKDVDSVIKHIQRFAQANTHNTLSPEVKKEYLELKVALFEMVDQFGYELVTDDGNEYFQTLCESALESAFSLLGFENDTIDKEMFYHEFDKCRHELSKVSEYNSNNFSYEENYFDRDTRKPSRYVKIYLDDHDLIRIKDKYNITNDNLSLQSAEFEDLLYDLIDKGLNI